MRSFIIRLIILLGLLFPAIRSKIKYIGQIAFAALMFFMAIVWSAGAANAVPANFAKNYGLSGSTAAVNATAVDGAGNTYIAGQFNGATLDIGGTTLTKMGGQDAFVAKLDSTGATVWARNYGGSAAAVVNAYAIAVDGSGNVYLGGRFYGSDLTTPALTHLGSNDAFALKLDSTGATVWARNYGGYAAFAYVNGIAVDGSGNVYLGGYFYNANLATPALTKIGVYDAFAFKLDSDGNTSWSKNYGGSGADTIGTAIVVDGSGDVYLGGYNFYANLTTPALTQIGTGDAFAFKLDSTGATTWAKNFGGSGARASGTGIAIDGSGNVYLGGDFYNANLTTPSLTLIGSTDAFAFKLDSDGNTIWAQNYGGSTAYAYGNAIAVDGSGNVYLGGYFNGANLTTPALTIIGATDAFAFKLDSDGNTSWAKNYGGSGATVNGNAIAVDGSDNVYLGGDFNGANLTSPALTKIGSQDAFIIKDSTVTPPTISTSSLLGGTVGVAYSQTVTAIDGTAPYSSWSAPGLPAGLSINASTGTITGTPTTAGTYSFTVSATDAASVSFNKLLSIVVAGSGVDLTVSALTSSADGHSVNVGDTVTINSTIANLGTSATTIGIPVFFYLSTDSNITTSDTLLSGAGLLGLAAGQSSNLTTTVTLPLNLAPGTYYIGAIVDPANYQHESNEANNTRATVTPFTVIRNVDLTVTATSTLDGLNTVKPGDPVTITAIVHNAGSTTTTAPDIAVSYYLSTDATITQTDRPIGASGLYRLAAGASGATSATVKLPLDLTPGATYYIGAIADPSNAQPETNKANNSNTLQPPTSFTVAANALADLTVSAPGYAASNVVGGDAFTVSAIVNNIGNAATTAPIEVSYYLTTDSNPAHLTTASGTLVGTSGVPGLAAGGSSSTSATVTLPLNLAAGTYYIGAIVDAGNVQPELLKTNNTAVGAALTVVASSVDLTISTPTYSLYGSPMSGSPVTINPVTVTNNGNAPTTAPIVVSYYLTTDSYAPDLPETGIFIGSSGVPGLGAGGSSTTSAVTAHLPLNLAPGTYYIGAYVNPGNVQPESNTANNWKVGAWFVVSASTVQLSVASLNSHSLGHTVHTGSQIGINANVHNGGSAATTAPVAVSYYLTTDSNAADLPGSGTAVGASGISHIAAGSNANTSVTATLPSTLPPGTYHIGAIVDPTNAEAFETNNKAVTAGTLIVIP